MSFRDWLYNVGSALSVLVNALIFGEMGESLSARIGRTDWLMKLPMPGWLREHFERAVG